MNIPSKVRLTYYELIITENCNLRCIYCYDDYFSDRTSCSYTPSMSLHMIDDVITFIKKTYDYNRQITISFFGGEPLLQWDFITQFVKKFNQTRIKKEYVLNTNATLLNEEKINFMVRHNFKPTISIDGTKESHDINRIDAHSKGSWEKTIQLVPELYSKSKHVNNVILNALMVINTKNIFYLVDSFEFLNKLGFTINILFDYTDNFSDDDLHLLKQQLKHLFIEKGYTNFTQLKKILNDGYRSHYCFTPYHAVSIAPSGKLYYCHQFVPKMSDSENTEYYGDIYNGYYNADYYTTVNNRIFMDTFESCNNCSAKNWCAGGCLAGHYFKTHDYMKLNPIQCKINLIINDIALKINKKRK